MQSLTRFLNNLILFILFLLFFLLIFENQIVLPLWLQVAGRFHPVVLHLPIGLIAFTVLLLFFQPAFKKKQFTKVMTLCLLLSALSAAIAALSGFFLSLQGEYGAEILRQHKIGGIAVSVLTYLLLIGFQYDTKNALIVYGGPVLLFVVLIITGHKGSILTHGENYLWLPLAKGSADNVNEATGSLYQLAVKPVLEKKCFTCHNESKAKGGLIMTTPEKFRKGGKKGQEWVEGFPDSSRLIRYIHLPLEDDDHMPPDGKPQLSSFEIALLEAWIGSGADFEKKISDYASTDTLVTLARHTLRSGRKLASSHPYNFKAVSPALIEKLNTPFRAVFPLHQGSPALQADFFVKEFFQIQALEELNEVNEQLVVLNLSKMPVTDADLKRIADFKNLEKLNLNFTSVKGEGLQQLTSLQKLKSLSLSGTNISKSSLIPALAIPSLKEVFIWNTSISESEWQELVKGYPKISFTHTLFKDAVILPLSKPVLVNEGVLKRDEPLQLRHAMPGVTIRYSFNGKPDSVSGPVYERPIPLSETTKLQAIACKPGWYCSPVLEAVLFVEGIKPSNVELLASPDKQYPGEGASSLTDGRKGITDVFKEPSWLGYRDNALEAGFDFGDQPPLLSKLVVSYGESLGSYIFPPAEVEVWGGENKQKLKLLASIKPGVPESDRSQRIEPLTVPLNKSNHSYYKVIARPIAKLPLWHSGKGQKGWVFIDEVFFY
jgi:uncharacterized membrane protein